MANFSKSDLNKFKYIEKLALVLDLNKEIEFIVKNKKFKFIPVKTKEVKAFIKRPSKKFFYDDGYLNFFLNPKDKQAYRFIDVNKSPFSGAAATAGKETKMQELAFMGACAKDDKYILKVFPTISPEWYASTGTSAEVFLEHLKRKVDLSEMSRDKGSALLIKNKYKALGQNIGLLNPADVWYTSKKYRTLRKDLLKITTMPELNKFLLTKMSSLELIGISLKKTKKAKISLLNTTMYKPKTTIKVKSIKINLEFLETGKFKSQDTIVKLDGNKSQVILQIKANSPGGKSNLKYECSSKGAKARLGKAPVKQVQELINYENNWRDLSYDLERLEKMFKIVQKMPEFCTDLKSNFVLNMVEALEHDESLTRSKMMQIEALYAICKTQDITSTLVSIVDLSQKKGHLFSPFLKIS